MQKYYRKIVINYGYKEVLNDRHLCFSCNKRSVCGQNPRVNPFRPDLIDYVSRCEDYDRKDTYENGWKELMDAETESIISIM